MSGLQRQYAWETVRDKGDACAWLDKMCGGERFKRIPEKIREAKHQQQQQQQQNPGHKSRSMRSDERLHQRCSDAVMQRERDMQ